MFVPLSKVLVGKATTDFTAVENSRLWTPVDVLLKAQKALLVSQILQSSVEVSDVYSKVGVVFYVQTSKRTH